MGKVKRLKNIFEKFNIDGYLIPKNDEYFCEYVSDFNNRLKFISSFSGSFGIAVVLKKNNYLFVDGRYTTQANQESGRYFKIKTLPNQKPNDLFNSKNLKIGYDPKLFTFNSLNNLFKGTKCKLFPIQDNLIDYIWRRKKSSYVKKFYTLPNNSVGKKFTQKLNKVILEIKKRKADYLFITSSENNAWFLNLRGQDTKYTPLPFGYMLVSASKELKFFCNLKKISNPLKSKFKNVNFIDIKYIEENLKNLINKKIIIDDKTCSIYFQKIILKKNFILKFEDPIYLLKSIKSKIEIKNIMKSHIADGVALTKYLFWIKSNFSKIKITEMSGENKLLKYRKKNKNFKSSSFPTISGSGKNGAIIHYKATKKTNRVLKKGDIYLVDSGGQYNFGTTDVTRTISLGNSNKRIKEIFTRVLKGHIAVTNYSLKKNSTGSLIDTKARKYLKQINLDYPHGTGHGVGYFLNVHEGPHAISKNNKVIFKKGMVVSNEPGYYEKNKFGIRIENLIFVNQYKNKKFFENFTLVPIDKDLIDRSLLNKTEKCWLNRYHNKVFYKLRKFMGKKDLSKLSLACSAI